MSAASSTTKKPGEVQAHTPYSLEQIRVLYGKSDGKAWSPPRGRSQHPILVDLVARGWLCHCVMRCGFEAFDDGVGWTEAAHLALRATTPTP